MEFEEAISIIKRSIYTPLSEPIPFSLFEAISVINKYKVQKPSTNSNYATALLKDDALAKEVSSGCMDPAHDDRWCSTCESRSAGIDDYRTTILQRLNADIAALRIVADVG